MPRWTEFEIEKLKQLVSDGVEYSQIAIKLGRKTNTINVKVKRLGLKSPKHLSDSEKKILIELWEDHTLEELSYIMNRPISTIHKNALSLGLKRFDREIWTDEEVEIASKMRSDNRSIEEIAEVLGRTKDSVIGKVRTEKADIKLDRTRHRFWNDERDEILKQMFPEFTDKQIAQRLNCKDSRVANRRKELGLRRR